MGYLGAAGFTALFGVVVAQVGYGPLFAMLAIFDLVAAAIIFLLASQPTAADVAAGASA